MATRIAFTEVQFAELAAALGAGDETAAVVATSLVGAAPTDPGGSLSLLAQSVTWVPEDAYVDRSPTGLSIASTGWVPAFRAAVAEGHVPVFAHTHPGGFAEFSSYDDLVDADLAAAAKAFGAPVYASIVVAGTPDAPVVAARIFDLSSGAETATVSDALLIDAVRVAGSGLRLFLPPLNVPVDRDDRDRPAETPAEAAREDAVFDRQIRMLGAAGQRTLQTLRVAIIGAGGTGTAVAVQIARLGIRDLVLVDDDVVTEPTPTRGHGMRVADLGRPKVAVLAEHLRDIGLGTAVREFNTSLNDPVAVAAIAHADIVFSCVDGHGARLVLNRWAYAHLAAVIDLAVLVSTIELPDGGRGVEIEQRVTWLAPGCACLLCRGRLDPALAYAENLDPETRKRLAGEGYVAAAETPQPAVVTLTTSVAALAATELLLRVTGLGKTDATELLLRSHVGELRRNRVPQRTGCFCTDPEFIGRGVREPYLDLLGAWT